MDIRTITIGSSYPDRDWSSVEKLAQAAKALKQKFQEQGINVQSLRYSTQFWGAPFATEDSSKAIIQIQKFEKRLLDFGISYGSIGTILPRSSEKAYQILPEIIKNTDIIFSTISVANDYAIEMNYSKLVSISMISLAP